MTTPQTLSQRTIFQTWWPLAASWMLMGLELPLLSAVVARLGDAKVHLAAYGGVVFSLALLIESPIIMLLAASTALSKDWASYQTLRRFMMAAGFWLTVLHVLLAFTPLYDWVVVPLFGPPSQIVEPARVGLMLMTPWTWAIAYRRFHQGVLIRFGRSRAITVGTAIRLTALSCVLGIGYALAKLGIAWSNGIVVATSAIAVAVVAEALYIGLRVHPVLRTRVQPAPAVSPPLSYRAFTRFYLPLVMTSLLGLLAFPIGTAAMSRMPNALDSLAVWPVISGLLFLLLSLGIAYNEVVVTLLDRPGAVRPLRRFSWGLAATTTGLLGLLVGTPLVGLWFAIVSGLPPALVALAQSSLWFSMFRPALSAVQSWQQGTLIQTGHTRGVTEAVGVFLAVSGALLAIGVGLARFDGIYVVQFAFSMGAAAQAGWLWWRSRPVMDALERATPASAEVTQTV